MTNNWLGAGIIYHPSVNEGGESKAFSISHPKLSYCKLQRFSLLGSTKHSVLCPNAICWPANTQHAAWFHLVIALKLRSHSRLTLCMFAENRCTDIPN